MERRKRLSDWERWQSSHTVSMMFFPNLRKNLGKLNWLVARPDTNANESSHDADYDFGERRVPLSTAILQMRARDKRELGELRRRLSGQIGTGEDTSGYARDRRNRSRNRQRATRRARERRQADRAATTIRSRRRRQVSPDSSNALSIPAVQASLAYYQHKISQLTKFCLLTDLFIQTVFQISSRFNRRFPSINFRNNPCR